MADTVGELSVKVTADTSAMQRKIASDSEAAGKSAGSKFSKGLAGVGGLLAGIGVAGVAAGGAIAAFGVNAAAANEQAAVSFTKLLGSGEKAQAFMAQLNEFAAKTPFELPGLRDAASRLLATGTAAEDVIPIMTRIGDATAAVGTGEDGIKRSVAALQKMQITGKVTAESMNMLSEAGVNTTDALAAHLGKSPQQIAEMVTKGQIKVQDVFKAIESGAGASAQRVEGMMDKQSATFAGMVSTLKDTVGQGLAEAAQPLLESLKTIMPQITSNIQSIISSFGPLIGQIGPLLGGILPIIQPLVGAITTIATAIAGSLVGAIKDLLPALEPVLKVFGELASGVGARLAPIIAKVAQLLGRVLQAVTPLLEPLMDLVFTILDAAWPIIEVVADVLLILVDALAPLLVIVGQLLGPIGQLVNVALAAIMPIIQPLLPVISALAAVLGDVLGRAIGLVITSAGYLIQAWSQVGSFLIGSVLQPIASAFLSWAETVVGAAADAFGWVPGLGDKLNTARDAISTFKDNAEKGISDAAETIGVKGKEIGEGLVDQGLAAMKDPGAAAAYSKAGTSLGKASADSLERAIASGQVPAAAASAKVGQATATSMATGLTGQTGAVTTAGQKVGQAAATGINTGVASAATTVTTGATTAGGNVATGLTAGVTKGEAKPKQAAIKMAQGVLEATATTLGTQGGPSAKFQTMGTQVVAGLRAGLAATIPALRAWWQTQMAALITDTKTTLQIHSPSRVFMTMGGNVTEGFGIGLESIGKVNDEFLSKMDKAVQASEAKIDKWVSKTREQLDKAVEAWRDYRDEVFASITGNVNFADAMRATEDQQRAVQDAQKALSDAQARAAQPNATDSDKQAVTDAQTKLAEAQAAVKTFEGNLGAMLDQSDFFGTAFAKASDAMIAQFGADSPIWATMREQMLAAGPVEGAALANYIATNGLSPEMQTRLLNWNAWAGEVATDQANKNQGQGVQMAVDAMTGLEDKIKKERQRLVKMGEKMGDGVVVGFKDKESDFKKAVRGYINAAYAELGIHSPSRVFAEIGRYTAEGFNNGVADNMAPFEPPAVVAPTTVYAPSLGLESTLRAGSVAPIADVKVFLGDKELTDLVDVQIDRRDSAAMDLVIAGRRF